MSVDELMQLYERPAYPVYKAFLVKSERGKRVEEVTEDTVKQFCEVLESLRNFLNYVKDVTIANRPNMSVEEKLELIADSITLFFKAPLIQEVLPQNVPNPLRAYVLERLWPIEAQELQGLKWIVGPIAGEAWEKYSKSKLREILDSTKTTEMGEKMFFAFPADTRPGLNTSSLIVHLLLTSSIAWSIYMQRKKEGDRYEAAKLRLAAIFHDIGKPFNWQRHYEAGAQIANVLLNGILDKSTLEDVVRFIREHHIEKADELSNVLKSADIFSSQTDRLSAFAKNMAKGYIDDPELAYSSGKEAWEYWRRLYEKNPEIITRMSIEFAEALAEQSMAYSEGPRNHVEDGIEFWMIDVGGIQSFVYRTERLPAVVMASMAVDLLIMARIPIELQRRIHLPYECFLYTAGGNITLIAPAAYKDKIEEALKHINEKILDLGITLRWVNTPLSADYRSMIEDLARQLGLKKLQPVSEPDNKLRERIQKFISMKDGTYELCKLCYSAPKEGTLRIEMEEIECCLVCKELSEEGISFHFNKRWDADIILDAEVFKPSEVFGLNWTDVKGLIIEIVAGHDVEELKKLKYGGVERRNLGVIKADGNLMGAFIGEAIHISDAVERSARIDLAMKKAYRSAIKALFEGVRNACNEEAAKRAVTAVKLGTLYIGGDDTVIFLPSWATLPFAYVLCKEFAKNLPGRSLSVGVVSVNVKHSVWAAVNACDALLEQAKKLARKELYLHVGAACYDVVDQGILTGSIAEDRMDYLRSYFGDASLTAQPLSIWEETCKVEGNALVPSLESVLRIVTGVEPEVYERLFEFAWKASRCSDVTPENPQQNRLKSIRNFGREAINVATSNLGHPRKDGHLALLLAMLYARCQATRTDKKDVKEAWEVIASVFQPNYELADGKCIAMFADIDRAAKFLGGGFV